MAMTLNRQSLSIYKILSKLVVYFFSVYLEKEFKKLKDNYRKCIKRRQIEKLRPGKHTPMCNFFNELSFLNDHMGNLIDVSRTENISSPPLPASSIVILKHLAPAKQINETVKVQNLTKTEAPVYSRTELSQPPSKNSFTSSSHNNNNNYQNILSNSSMVAAVTPSHRPPPEKKIRIIRSANDDTDSFNSKPDTHQLFCDSLVDPIRNLPPKKSKLAKMKIMQILYELED